MSAELTETMTTWADVEPGDVVRLRDAEWTVVAISCDDRTAEIKLERNGLIYGPGKRVASEHIQRLRWTS